MIVAHREFRPKEAEENVYENFTDVKLKISDLMELPTDQGGTPVFAIGLIGVRTDLKKTPHEEEVWIYVRSDKAKNREMFGALRIGQVFDLVDRDYYDIVRNRS